MEKIRVILIEDNRLLRKSTTSILHTQPDFEVIPRFKNSNTFYMLNNYLKILFQLIRILLFNSTLGFTTLQDFDNDKER